jgi:BASS family bile acid:Na+ symporter|tara:strand:+ start:643 stop:1485 length:843 start_codon:yes stop_codon:yes gene_type:complete
MAEAVNNSLPLNIVTLFIPVLFYFLGLKSNFEQFKDLFSEKKSLIYGFCIQLLLLPLIGIIISELFSTSLFAIAAVIVLIVPGGHVSGLLSHIKKGNVPLSVFLTSFASMISPLTIIFWLTVITTKSGEFSINLVESLTQLIMFILTPFVFGMIVKIKFPKFSNIIFNPLDKFLKILIIVVSVWTPVDLATYILDNIREGLMISLLSLLAIFVSSRVLINYSKIDTANAKTLQIEALCQNFPIVLGISIALEMPEVAIYGMIYYLISMVFAVSYSFSKKF